MKYCSLGLLLLLVGGVTSAQAQPVTVTGIDGVAATIDDPARIVTLGGPVTEILYALGLGDRVVAADLSSIYPPDVLEKPRLGYFRQASAEGILSQAPSLVLTIDGFGPPAVVQQLRAAGVPVLILESPESVGGAIERIRTLAAAFHRTAEGQQLVERIEQKLAAARTLQQGEKPGVLFIYARGAGLVNVAGQRTPADAIIELAGGTNVVTGFEGFRPLTAEAAVVAAPEVIVIPERGLESIGGTEGLLMQPGLSLTPAGQNREVVAVDDAMLLNFGPRLGDGVLTLTKLLYAAPDGGTQ